MIARRILAHPSMLAGLLVILAFAVIALAAPLLLPPTDTDSPYQIPRFGYSPQPAPPDAEHPLGLLPKQYDILYGLVWGTRIAFQVGLGVTLARLAIGALIGLVSGYLGRWIDALIMRIIDAFLSFPIVAAAMVMVSLYGRELIVGLSGRAYLMPHGEEKVIMVTLIAFGWMSYARLVRGNVLAEREKEYIQAARAGGVGHVRLILRHLWPNVRQGLFVLAASDVGAVVILVATFAFIGLVTPPFQHMEADWGQMLTAARDWIVGAPNDAFIYWYTYLPVSAAIVLFSIGWNLIGDGLRDLLDPRLR
jgi:peptide/nickel transport system permease protein